jgi:pilus assembly protein CpaB
MISNERHKRWLLLALSIALGCCSAWAIGSHISNRTRELEKLNSVEYVQLLVASRELTRDTIIQAEDLKEHSFQAQGIANDALFAHEVDAVIGKRLRVDLQVGAWVNASALAEPVVPTLAKRLKPFLRAVTLQVDPVNAMSGLINPGDYIDIFVSFDHLGRRVTAPLLQSVEVLATDRITSEASAREDQNESRFSTITVAVSSADSIRLVAARQSGVISATMSADAAPETSTGHALGLVSLEQILGLDQADTNEPIRVIYGDRLDGEIDVSALGLTHPSSEHNGRLDVSR